MVLIKINGERNSGTTYLELLCKANFNNTWSQINSYRYTKPIKGVQQKFKYVNFWKHDIPTINNKKIFNNMIEEDRWKNGVPKLEEINKNMIDIFVIRNVKPWTVSMFKNPYHLMKIDNFKKFLESKMKISEKGEFNNDTKKVINHDDENRTIFEIRYYKLEHIFEYFENNNNVIIINLDLLQNDKYRNIFLSKINEIYKINDRKEYVNIDKHIKSKENDIKNRNYDINSEDYNNIYNKYINIEMEDKIKNIFWMKYDNEKHDFTPDTLS